MTEQSSQPLFLSKKNTQVVESKIINRQLRVQPEQQGRRLDQVLAELFPEFSRARLQQWLKSGQILLDGGRAKPSHKVLGTEQIDVAVTIASETALRAEPISLDIVFEDEQLIVINKPAGLVVHPASGHADGTLQNALLHHCPGIDAVPRAGIVHRLDKLTTGVMVAAKSLQAHKSIVDQLQARTMKREYQALVHGALVAGDTVKAPIARHPKDRTKMAVAPGGKPATTHYRISQRFRDFCLLNVKLETGRTHQIRVHMAHIRHPIVGDPVYGARFRPPAGASPSLLRLLEQFRRQALHARRLTLVHPTTNQPVQFEATVPDDMAELISGLQDDPAQHA